MPEEGHCSASDIRAITPNASTYIARLKKRHILRQDNGRRGQ